MVFWKYDYVQNIFFNFFETSDISKLRKYNSVTE